MSWEKYTDVINVIYDISVFSDMTTSVFFSDMTYTFMTSVYFSHDIYIHDISVFQICEQQLW
jgi:hypothetical protein